MATILSTNNRQLLYSREQENYDPEHEFYLKTTKAPEECDNPFFLVKGEDKSYAAK